VPYHLRHERVGPLLENERRWGKVHDDFKREKAASALKGDSATGIVVEATATVRPSLAAFWYSDCS
jgi:hypothetical protein